MKLNIPRDSFNDDNSRPNLYATITCLVANDPQLVLGKREDTYLREPL